MKDADASAVVQGWAQPRQRSEMLFFGVRGGERIGGGVPCADKGQCQCSGDGGSVDQGSCARHELTMTCGSLVDALPQLTQL